MPVASNKYVGERYAQLRSQGESDEGIAKDLVRVAYQKFSKDNISVLIRSL